MRALLLVVTSMLGASACGPTWHCAPGYTPVCQSGALHGTRCVCEPPRRYIESR